MNHIAIDLGARQSQICVRDGRGTVLQSTRWATKSLRGYLKQSSHSRVIVETCAEGFAVADIAVELGHEVRVVPGTLVRALGVGSRGVKTDKRDAEILSEASVRMDLPSVHRPSQRSREIKTMCGMRDALVSSRTQLINTVRGWLRGFAQGPIAGSTPATFCKRVREKYPDAPVHVERQLKAIELLNEQIKAANADVVQVTCADEVCVRLQTVPGVGPVIAIRFVAAIDEIERFGSAHALQSYLGLVPGEHSSSERKRRTHITKAGSAPLRAALVQGAHALRNRSRRVEDPMASWALDIELRRGKQIAIVALARKMAGVLYALWKSGETYDPTYWSPEKKAVRLKAAQEKEKVARETALKAKAATKGLAAMP